VGIVYRVRDEKLDRDLALKLMHAEFHDNQSLCRRFVEEAQVMGQLQHPGVPPVFERDELPDGRLYYTMKLVQGRTWQALLQERPDSAHDLPRSLVIFEQVAQTVAYAHSKHVLHRDLKPANIMVGRFAEVQVMDWGASKVLGSPVPVGPAEAAPISVVQTVRSRDADSDTQAGTAIGTYAYMPPEQAEGAIEQVEERADVFALGSILCEVLTGAPAYTGRNRDEVRRKSVRGDLADALTRLDACGADAELVALAKDCLAPEPLDRPRDAGIVSQRISGYLAAVQERLEAAKLARVAAETKAIEERKRRRWQLGLAATAFVLMALGGAGLFVASNRLIRADNLLDEASKLCDQAERDPAGGDPNPPSAALKQAEEALGELSPLRHTRLAALRQRIGGIGKLHMLLRGLEAIRGNRSREFNLKRIDPEDAGGFRVSVLDLERTDREYAEAFRAFGLDIDTLDPKQAGSALAQYAAVVEIAAALDEWACARFTLLRGQQAASWQRLIETARAADRDERRDALRAQFGRWNKDALQALATSRDLHTWPAASLVLLARALKQSGDQKQATAVLETAWRCYPGDY
jgi:serine/threonine-protein kinase